MCTSETSSAGAVASRRTSPQSLGPELAARFALTATPPAADGIESFWVHSEKLLAVLRFLKNDVAQPYRMLFDLTAIDERWLRGREGPERDFTVVYHLLSLERNAYVRLKVPLLGETPSLPTAVGVWPAANWYEREVWDMFGIRFDGHPHLARILMPRGWVGHPLRKEHPARATEMGSFTLDATKHAAEEQELRFAPEEWGLARHSGESELLFLNLGPQHPGTHGVLRIVLQLDGEEIIDAVPDIGFHHRAAEKMAERQSWHTFIPYTDRVDYLAGVINNLAYLNSVEALAGITVPPRARVVRIMLTELWRITSHLAGYGTFAQDVGQLSPVFYMFTDRERFFEINEAITGFRMHPSYFRLGGLAADLPRGWDKLVRDFLPYMRHRLREYDSLVMRNAIFRARTKGVGAFTLAEAIDWGVTGPNLRACGLEWDVRKKQPYGGYHDFEFDIPTAQAGDCYARAQVRVEEMRQSLRIVEQCLAGMPEGPVKAEHPLTTPPPKARTMHDIETLIHHFLNVSWGPVLPAGEAMAPIEAAKGVTGYYAVSDKNVHPYRLRIRTPSFAHLQTLPRIARGLMISDLVAILGSMDYVLADVDR